MWTSVPHTPARRTRIRTSSSRMRGSATSFSLKPGDADSFTSAFTCTNSGEDEFTESESQTCLLRDSFGSHRALVNRRDERLRSMQACDHMVSLTSIESPFLVIHAHLLQPDPRNEFQTNDVDSFE